MLGIAPKVIWDGCLLAATRAQVHKVDPGLLEALAQVIAASNLPARMLMSVELCAARLAAAQGHECTQTSLEITTGSSLPEHGCILIEIGRAHV